jgi:hypothetical protein
MNTRQIIRPSGSTPRFSSSDGSLRMVGITLPAEPYHKAEAEPQRITYRPDPARTDRATLMAAADAALPMHRRPCQPDADPNEDAYAVNLANLARSEGHRPGCWTAPSKNAAKKHPQEQRQADALSARIEALMAAIPDGWHTTSMMREHLDWHPSLISAALRAATGKGLLQSEWTFKSGVGCYCWQYRRVTA